jgi:hypothetical protein
MDQCSGHDIPPAVDPLTDRRGHDLELGLPLALPERVLTRRRLGTSMPYGLPVEAHKPVDWFWRTTLRT